MWKDKVALREDDHIDYVFKLLDIPWWNYGIAVVIGAVVWKAWRWEVGLLVGYAFILLTETVFARGVTPEPHFQPALFWSWREWQIQKNQILTNVIMFVPVGVLTGLIWNWRGILVAAGLSVGIEVLQLITTRGLCEFDDVIHNTVGAVIGVGIVIIIKMMLGAIDENNRENH